MKQIYALEHFNNYFNHKVIKYDTLEEYLHNSDKYEPLAGVNFNPADGVNTTHIINAIDINPDYLLVVDDANNIVSRWFITDAVQIRNGQHKLSLLRDVIAEHYSEVIDAPCLVDRAMVDIENPLLYNAEGDNTFNQIKQSEHLLKDETNTNWIVGYIARDTNIEGEISSIKRAEQNYKSLETLNITFYDDKDYGRGGYFDYGFKAVFSAITRVGMSSSTWTIKSQGIGTGFNDGLPRTEALNKYNANLSNVVGHTNSNPTKEVVERAWTRAYNKHKTVLGLDTIITLEQQENINLLTTDETNEFIYGNNNIFYSVKQQKYYKMQLGTPVLKHYKLVPTKDNARIYQSLIDTCQSFYNELPDGGVIRVEGKPFEIDIDIYNQAVILTEVPQTGVIKTTISPNRVHLTDAPFDMFAIPYNIDNYNLAQQINLKLANNVYDIQLLPYCPVRRLIGKTGSIDISLGTEGIDYNKISGIGYESYILWADKSSDVFRIKHKIAVPNNNIDLKIYSETTFVRLVSPNYNGVFEFNAAKNGGVDYFEVSYTYKPYSPYIHVNPNFKGLYGTDFNDSRGLQCNGDFSVSMTSDAWIQYEINNKNYQNIFNTEIKTMDENQRTQNISNSISAGLSAFGAGAMLSLVGSNPWLGIFGGIGSAMAGAADIGMQNQMYQNNRQAKIDTFNMSLGNIKARPDSLTKVSAHTITNKYFPFVEIYSSTDAEKEIYKNKLTYYGMSIKALGKISDYINIPNFSYFKGSLVRLDSIKDDTHVVNQIAQELNGGLYF